MNTRRRKNSGFTLIEAILCVAVLAVITAVAIPAAAALRGRLHMAELDAYARQIYLAAQNELTAMKASGALPAWAEGRIPIGYMPSDYPAEAEPDPGEGMQAGWERLIAVPGRDLQRALDSIEDATAAGGHAWIELDPFTGHVYAVFYAESGFGYGDDLPREYDGRKNHSPQLGYYGGGSLAPLPETLPDIEVKPELKILNGEELAVILTFPEDGEEGALPRSITGFTATLRIEGLTSGATLTQTFEKGDLDRDALYLILDSLDPNNAFDKATASGFITGSVVITDTFIPGEDLRASVTIEGTAYATTIGGSTGQANITGSAASEEFNSLFADRDDGGNLTVSHVRHLNNLREGVYDPDRFGSIPAAGTITITHQGIIDFDFGQWTEGEDYWTLDENPLDSFASIEADAGLAGFAYAGNNGTVANFPIVPTGGGGTGLFAATTGSGFENLTLENCSAEGSSNVGVLVGSAEGGSFRNIMLADCHAAGSGSNVGVLAGSAEDADITHCGAHLTYQETGMPQWIADHTVTGQNNVGGLVGLLSDGEIAYSYGAVNVKGASGVGGLIGRAVGADVTGVYASGDITASGDYAGGLIGLGGDVAIDQCYTTSDVDGGGDYIGGILGGVADGDTSSSIQNATVYGMVPMDGNRETIGRIAGAEGVDDTTTCFFLQKDGYGVNNSTGTGIAYMDLVDEALIGENVTVDFPTYPYDEDLQRNYFPFPRIAAGTGAANSRMVHADGKLIHHGDWPLEIELLDVNLVYYERYADGAYGYYADAYLGSGFTGTGASTRWNTDSLRYPGKNGVSRENAVCVEDGYALLCTTDLYLPSGEPGYEYSLDPKATGDDQPLVTGQARIVENKDAVNEENSLLLDGNASLRFTSREGSRNVYYTLNGAKVYRLPFDLQITERVSATSFWEELTIRYYEKDENGGLSGTAAAETYWYCPDFAKNAVNPNPDGAAANPQPEEPFAASADAGKAVYVRSARQLNGLGRSTYYWQRQNNQTGNQIYFVQETDIDFFTYAGEDKLYCGVDYDLMDTTAGNPYRNKPIGKSRDDTAPGNFRNNYDGKGNWILDYCQDWEDDQFVGLFGEVWKGTLQNIVMKASGRMESAPYIRSSFVSAYSRTAAVIGVGGIAGLLWVDNYSNERNEISSMVNCAISGYEISYLPGSSNVNTNRNPGVGGLAGLCNGRIENSTAVSMTIRGEQHRTETLGIGGVVGAIDYDGKPYVHNCYAGMNTLEAENSDNVYTGGILGGNIDIPGGNNAATANYNVPWDVDNCYSFQNELQTRNSAVEPAALPYPIAENTANLADDDCYYLKEEGISEDAVGEARDILEMCAAPFAEESYPVNEDLANRSYPFTAVVEHDGTYVHYGDWPDVASQIVYYEKTETAEGKTEWNVFAPGSDGLDRENARRILDWGYALLLFGDEDGIDIATGTNGETKAWEDGFTDAPEGAPASLRPLSDELKNALASSTGLTKAVVTSTITGSDGSPQEVSVTQHVNTLFGAAVFEDGSGGMAGRDDAGELTGKPFEIRTPEQLRNIAAFKGGSSSNGMHYYFLQSHDIGAGVIGAGDTAIIPEFRENWTYDGGGNRIAGLTLPLFGAVEENAAVRKAALIGAEIEAGENAAALALTNAGIITESFAAGSVTAENGNAAGLVYENSGSISHSYANCRVSGENAAGFVWAQAGGSIEYCYSGSDHHIDAAEKGYIEAADTAAGFLGGISGGTVKNCYSVAAVMGGTAYGFGPGDADVTDCRWLKQTENDGGTAFNEGVTDEGGGTPETAIDIVKARRTGDWETAPSSHPVSNGLSRYPYPGVGLDHYGDWPQLTPVPRGEIGVARLYQQWFFNTYYAGGAAIDVESGEQAEEFNDSGTGQNTLLVMVGEDITLSEWSVAYGNNVQQLSLTSPYGQTLQNANGFTAYALPNAAIQNGATVTLTHVPSDTDFVFTYGNNRFAYTGAN